MTHSQVIRAQKAMRRRRRGALDRHARFRRRSFMLTVAIIVGANALLYFFVTRHLV